MVNRPKIDSDIKREVRKRCGYGCVVCGSPFPLDYDHITEWSEVLEHKAENITLLCSKHHAEKTRGILPLEMVVECNNNPYAIRYPEKIRSIIYFKKNVATIKIATNELYVDIHDGAMIYPFIVYKRVPFHFIVEDGNLLLSGEFHDKKGDVIVKIDKNEVQFATQKYDIELVGQKIIIRERKGIILLKINVNPSDAIIDIEYARFDHRDISINLLKSKLLIKNTRTGILYFTASSNGVPGNVGFSIFSPGHIGRIFHMKYQKLPV
jgi:trigger factor